MTASTLKSRSLELEVSLRELEMKAEVLRRDKCILLEDLDKSKFREKEYTSLTKEKVDRLESSYETKLANLASSKEEEIEQLTRKYEEKIKTIQNANAELEKVRVHICYTIQYASEMQN